jgi:hypothetical protein
MFATRGGRLDERTEGSVWDISLADNRIEGREGGREGEGREG